MKFLDASILVEACLANSTHFKWADDLVAGKHATSAHALAEAYATLSGDKRLRIKSHDSSRMVVACAENLTVRTLDPDEMIQLIENAPGKGVCGGSFFDAIHAHVARKTGCQTICTLNPSHFRHVAPDMDIEAPD